ncbi:GIY-YIG nuclease family protein [Hyunsoonleella sp. SJ7]|uniref:GIY-YIG nuclease family protein n=1 Tax=Hyunsoonleella aquatilis TaxID=2762758 RepID=A0A923HF37_9FLAO|nr:GIY-YIG nuclease family protein [Hyunsoonleella aquatilis]MBC3757292.1 GIY-YIG nuclease family protein [Hyunsoonleella aquatilis]
MKQSHVYIITNKNNTVLYTGVTSNLVRRMYQHKTKAYIGFASKYNCEKLVYYEAFDSIDAAIEREKQIKKYKRYKKINLIEKENASWKDLSDGWLFYFG